MLSYFKVFLAVIACPYLPRSVAIWIGELDSGNLSCNVNHPTIISRFYKNFRLEFAFTFNVAIFVLKCLSIKKHPGRDKV